MLLIMLRNILTRMMILLAEIHTWTLSRLSETISKALPLLVTWENNCVFPRFTTGYEWTVTEVEVEKQTNRLNAETIVKNSTVSYLYLCMLLKALSIREPCDLNYLPRSVYKRMEILYVLQK